MKKRRSYQKKSHKFSKKKAYNPSKKLKSLYKVIKFKNSFKKRNNYIKKKKHNVMLNSGGYIPAKDLTDPIDYAASAASRYDSFILNDVLKFKIEEARLLKKLGYNI